MPGKLEIIIGPMFSGKSTELIRKIRLLQKINKKVLITKPIIDIRYNENKLTSHNLESIDCVVLNKLNEISIDNLNSYHTIVIDEGQFFPDLYETVVNWIDNSESEINIIIAGLDGDFKRQPIGDILMLIPYADKCIKLNSLCKICNDGTKAPFTSRLTGSTEKVLIGGEESYIPLCRKHYLLNQ